MHGIPRRNFHFFIIPGRAPKSMFPHRGRRRQEACLGDTQNRVGTGLEWSIRGKETRKWMVRVPRTTLGHSRLPNPPQNVKKIQKSSKWGQKVIKNCKNKVPLSIPLWGALLVLEKMGAGGFAEVYLVARHDDPEEIRAVKVSV